MTRSASGRKQEFVALEGGDSVPDEVRLLLDQIAQLERDLEAERATVAGLHAQLTVLSRQLDTASEREERGGLLGRRRR